MKAQDAVDRDALRMIGTMLRFVRVVDQQFRRNFPGTSLTDLSVLTQLGLGVDSPSALADALHLDRPRVTRITDHLVELGYIEREEDREDRRRCLLHLTGDGKAYLDDAHLKTSRVVDALLDELGGADRDSLLRGLEAVRPIVDRR